jgi:hypothetical protein
VPSFGWPIRLALVASGIVLVGLLATAAWLTPSPAGYGTHRQLGLPPCTMVQWLDIRCPSCGMTTSWSHLMHGQPLAALRANSGGTLLALVAAACGPWMLASGLRGRWVIGRPHEMLALAVGIAIVIVTLVDWSIRLSFTGS